MFLQVRATPWVAGLISGGAGPRVRWSKQISVLPAAKIGAIPNRSGTVFGLVVGQWAKARGFDIRRRAD